MVVDEVSAWETYERATSKQARQLSSAYRRRSVQADDGGVVRRQSRHRHSIPVLGPTHALAGIGIKELEEAADKADAERVAARRSYSTQFSHFFDTLDSDREDALGSIEEDLVKKDLSPSVQENLLSIFSVYFEKHIHFEERQRKRNDDSTLKSVLKKIDGTMPGCQSYILNRLPLPHVVLFVELCLRGIGQVVFQNNPFCGLLILIGLFVQSTRVAVYGIIGLFCGTLIAYTLGFDNGLKRSGLFGYNSLLCGLAMATFYSSEQYQGYSTAVAISTIIFSCFSSVLFIFMGKLLAPYKSPPFTLPFNASVIMYLLATANMTRVNTGSVRVPMLPEYDVEFDTALTASDFFAGCVRGVGQIFLADNIVSGVLVLVGIAICSRISAFAALAGSALGAAAAVASGVPGADVTAGMYGFNSSLTFIAMYMFYTPSRGAFVLATFAGIMTVLAQLALAPWLQPYGLPFLTLPFCVVSLPFVVLQGTTSLVIAVPLSSMTVPEDHLKKVRYLSDGFAFLTEAINPNNTREFRRRESSIVHSKHFRSSMKEISRILEKEEELVDEELSLAFSNHSDRSKASTSYVSTTSFIQKFITKCRKKSIKGGWVLKEAPKIFKELDAKNQGSIFLEDFTSALRTVGLNDKTGLRFASLVFDIIDSDKSKSIERKEFVVFCVVSAKLLEVRKKISKFFDFVDVDGNEYIDFDEINAALEYLNEPPLSDADQDTLLSVIAVEDEEEGMDIVEIINYVTVAKVKAMMDDYRQHQTENESLHSISIDMNDTA